MFQNEGGSDTRQVVILTTLASGRKKIVARVAIMDDPRRLTRDADYPSIEAGRFNRAVALSTFGDARELSDADARREAAKLATQHGLAMSDPHVFDFSKINFPAKPKSGVRGASRSVPPPAPRAET